LVAYAWFGPAPPKIPVKPNVVYGAACGGLAAFTSTLIQIGAPPYYVFVLPQRLDKMVYVGTTIWFFAAVNVMKITPYIALGQFTTAGFATSVVLFPLAIASNFLGVWLVRITPTELFYKITYTIVFLLSLELTRRGVFGFIWPG
jgi:uncharacterized protein